MQLEVLNYKAKKWHRCQMILEQNPDLDEKAKEIFLQQTQMAIEAYEQGFNDALKTKNTIIETPVIAAPQEIKYIDSREVADAMGKNHKELLRDIRTYLGYLEGERNFALTDFFVEHSYQTSQNKVLPCYLISQKGCELIAHKMTGAKGVQFSAWYIDKFHAMKNALQGNIKPKMANEEQLQAPHDTQNLYFEKIDSKTIVGKPKGMFTATEIGAMLGVSRHYIGRLAKRYNLKTSENGQWINVVVACSGKPVKTFVYNSRGFYACRDAMNDFKSK